MIRLYLIPSSLGHMAHSNIYQALCQCYCTRRWHLHACTIAMYRTSMNKLVQFRRLHFQIKAVDKDLCVETSCYWVLYYRVFLLIKEFTVSSTQLWVYTTSLHFHTRHLYTSRSLNLSLPTQPSTESTPQIMSFSYLCHIHTYVRVSSCNGITRPVPWWSFPEYCTRHLLHASLPLPLFSFITLSNTISHLVQSVHMPLPDW